MDESRRKMIKSAAALAAAALGGAALATGGEAEAQERFPSETFAQASPLARELRVRELPMQNLGRALTDVNQEGLNAFHRDLQEYLTPLLDKNRGQVSDVTCSVGASVNVSG
jgi:hypothetical protein